MSHPIRFLVSEVHNFGGFFGGDTVTLSGAPWRDEQAEEQTLTIDESSLMNVRDRHMIAMGMLLELKMAGERVEQAQLLGATDHTLLRHALGAVELSGPIAEPVIVSYCCVQCGLWIAGAPVVIEGEIRCGLCGATIAV